jgi:hypothetical protein
MIQESLNEGPPISRTDGAFCNSNTRRALPKVFSDVIKAFSLLALLHALSFLFLILLPQTQNFSFSKARGDTGKNFRPHVRGTGNLS